MTPDDARLRELAEECRDVDFPYLIDECQIDRLYDECVPKYILEASPARVLALLDRIAELERQLAFALDNYHK